MASLKNTVRTVAKKTAKAIGTKNTGSSGSGGSVKKSSGSSSGGSVVKKKASVVNLAQPKTTSGGSAGKSSTTDRSSYGGSVYDQQYFTDQELASAARVRADAEAGKTTWADANAYVNGIRAKYGYSGGADGSRYIGLDDGNDRDRGFTYVEVPNKYAAQIDALTSDILNRDPFEYDPETDPLYQYYKQAYTRNGERAMQDTLGQVSARTGGLASSYAGSVAQQTYDNYMAELSDKIPELQQLAYSMYRDGGNDLRANLSMLNDLNNQDYDRWNANRNFNYGVYRDGISDDRYDQDWAYQLARDKVSDQRYADETTRSQSEDKAKLLAAVGDFSGYRALGYTDAEIATLEAAYDMANGVPAGGGDGNDGGPEPKKTPTPIDVSGAVSYDSAVALIRKYGGDSSALMTSSEWVRHKNYQGDTSGASNYPTYTAYLQAFADYAINGE